MNDFGKDQAGLSRRAFLKLSATAALIPLVPKTEKSGLVKSETGEGFILPEIYYERETMVLIDAELDEDSGHFLQLRKENIQILADLSNSETNFSLSSEETRQLNQISSELTQTYYLGTNRPKRAYFLRVKADFNRRPYYVIQIYDNDSLPRLFVAGRQPEPLGHSEITSDNSRSEPAYPAKELATYVGQYMYPQGLRVYPEGILLRYETDNLNRPGMVDRLNPSYFYQLGGKDLVSGPYSVVSTPYIASPMMYRYSYGPGDTCFIVSNRELPPSIYDPSIMDREGKSLPPTFITLRDNQIPLIQYVSVGDYEIFDSESGKKRLSTYTLWKNGSIFAFYNTHIGNFATRFQLIQIGAEPSQHQNVVDRANEILKSVKNAGHQMYVGEIYLPKQEAEGKMFFFFDENRQPHVLIFYKKRGSTMELYYQNLPSEFNYTNIDWRLQLEESDDGGFTIYLLQNRGELRGQIGIFQPASGFQFKYTEPRRKSLGPQA